jgi:hypothetical protein
MGLGCSATFLSSEPYRFRRRLAKTYTVEPSTQRWEYLTIQLGQKSDSSDSLGRSGDLPTMSRWLSGDPTLLLNKLGEQRWELSGVGPPRDGNYRWLLVLKRPRPRIPAIRAPVMPGLDKKSPPPTQCYAGGCAESDIRRSYHCPHFGCTGHGTINRSGAVCGECSLTLDTELQKAQQASAATAARTGSGCMLTMICLTLPAVVVATYLRGHR